ncbi:MAG: lipopolysaccharide heptosyltransferase I [SAR86 cluster bacterium]|jgi:heptosyltransferase I
MPEHRPLKILVVKLSSLGDVIHTLAAVSDAAAALPGIQIDWVVEEAFQEIPNLHPAVSRVIPVAIRRWRRNWWQSRREIRAALRALRETDYDLVIDAQGLIKSAIVSSLAKGRVVGLDRQSSREPLASLTYAQGYTVARQQHAVTRLRQLFASALAYPMPSASADFGLRAEQVAAASQPKRNILFFHGTTWSTKHWPVALWQQLAGLVNAAGYGVLLPHGNAVELARAEAIRATSSDAQVLPRMSLTALADCLAGVKGVVSVDTGPGHLAAAMDVPMVSLFGPTNPLLTAPYGQRQSAIAADDLACIPCMKRDCQYSDTDAAQVYPPCFRTTTPAKVWQRLLVQIAAT